MSAINSEESQQLCAWLKRAWQSFWPQPITHKSLTRITVVHGNYKPECSCCCWWTRLAGCLIVLEKDLSFWVSLSLWPGYRCVLGSCSWLSIICGTWSLLCPCVFSSMWLQAKELILKTQRNHLYTHIYRLEIIWAQHKHGTVTLQY